MNTNNSATTHEAHLEWGRSIATKTYLRGAITYANPPFVSISGFTVDELLAKNHHIFRHSDIPFPDVIIPSRIVAEQRNILRLAVSPLEKATNHQSYSIWKYRMRYRMNLTP